MSVSLYLTIASIPDPIFTAPPAITRSPWIVWEQPDYINKYVRNKEGGDDTAQTGESSAKKIKTSEEEQGEDQEE